MQVVAQSGPVATSAVGIAAAAAAVDVAVVVGVVVGNLERVLVVVVVVVVAVERISCERPARAPADHASKR